MTRTPLSREIHLKAFYGGSTHNHWVKNREAYKELLESLYKQYSRNGVMVLFPANERH